jgi:phospholipid/cholesterol/gamma-HCH transport system substrate-binding protein
MEQQRKRELQVGVTVIAALAIVIGGLMFFKNMRLNASTSRYAADFVAVEGLKIGDRVQVRGIRAGSVTSFDFVPGGVRVFFDVEGWVKLHEDAEVTLVQKGIVGEMVVEITPGEAAIVKQGHVFAGRSATSMLALGDKVDVSLEEFTALAKELRLILVQLRDEGQVVGLMTSTRLTLDNVSAQLAENRDDMRRIVRNVARLTETLDQSFGEGKLESTLATAQHATAQLDSTAIQLEAVARQSRGLLTKLETGEGTAARLLNDPALYDRADSTLQSLDRLIDLMRRDPKHFFKVSVF